MSLPLSRNSTYSDGMMVVSADLNDIQDVLLAFGLFFGDGSDGNVTLDGTVAAPSGMVKSASVYTLSRDFYARNLTVTGAAVRLKTNGFRLFTRDTLTTIGGATVNAGGVDATTRIGAVAGATGTLLAGAAGGNGGDGSASAQAGFTGTFTTNSLGGAGGAGGNSGGGTLGGVAVSPTVLTAAQGGTRNHAPQSLGHVLGLSAGASAWTAIQGGCGGSGGAASGPGAPGGAGGGGGGGGGVLVVCARVLQLAAITDVNANGGAGAAGQLVGASGSGGGGGGGGGVAFIAYLKKNLLTAFTVAGNAGGGVAGAAIGGGTAGAAGSNGTLIELVGA